MQAEPQRDAPPAVEGTRADREERLLARRLADREQTALADLYARYGRATFGFLLKALRDRATAEDVQQQVYLEVWQRASQFDPERGSLLTWVMLIARSRAIDQLRRRVPVPQDPAGSPALEIPVEAAVDELVEHWHMTDLLSRLPHEEAELLRRRFYGGLSQSEIASETGVPLGTVKMRMVSGLRRLRAMMEPEKA
ncbi:MAG TPA: sigma-70 family RNA polymerase sigma factor [Conexibacter sp.]|nr:sigma-70 family RNA polymerase sigma factor [Conexibacter sp.]